jgi:hypothetical protein
MESALSRTVGLLSRLFVMKRGERLATRRSAWA